ncbi:hypothetical protein DBR42_27010 [Pelomonas sp. HMWF004]|nr:hypothetical protein DBR42_27010 [Pelomonas sp. HMWF004]
MSNNKCYPWVATAAVLAALTACGGGGDSSPTPIVAMQDALNLGTGQTSSVLANDTVGSSPARVGSGGNATLSFTGTLPEGVTAADGVLAVARGTMPGSYTLSYQLCEAAATSNCATGTVALTVPRPVIKAVADVLILRPGETVSLLVNDLLDGVAATPATVIVSTEDVFPAGVTMGADGVLTVAIGAPPSKNSTPIYRICQRAAPTNCVEATTNLTIAAL